MAKRWPREVPFDAWWKACALATLADGPKAPLGQPIFARLQDRVLQDPAELPRAFQFLAEAVQFYPYDYNGSLPLERAYRLVGAAMIRSGHSGAFTAVSQAMLRSPIWLELRLAAFDLPMLREELWAKMGQDRWPEVIELCRQMEFWNRVGFREAEPPPWNDQVRYLVFWAHTQATGRVPQELRLSAGDFAAALEASAGQRSQQGRLQPDLRVPRGGRRPSVSRGMSVRLHRRDARCGFGARPQVSTPGGEPAGGDRLGNARYAGVEAGDAGEVRRLGRAAVPPGGGRREPDGRGRRSAAVPRHRGRGRGPPLARRPGPGGRTFYRGPGRICSQPGKQSGDRPRSDPRPPAAGGGDVGAGAWPAGDFSRPTRCSAVHGRGIRGPGPTVAAVAPRRRGRRG